MKEKRRFFCWHRGKDSLKNILIFTVLIGGTAVFWIYRIYAAALIVLVLAILLTGYQLRFVIVESGAIWQFHWMKKDITIPCEEIKRLDTRMNQNEIFVCVYGERDIMEFPYRKKTVWAVLEATGLSMEDIRELLAKQGEDFEKQKAGWQIERKTVLLDGLTRKKPFCKIEVIRK